MTESQWQIAAFKYGGIPHYEFPATLLEDDGEQLKLVSPLGTILTHHTRGFRQVMARRAEAFFWRNRWYNVYANYYPNGALENFYCNVGLPPSLKQNTISYVDLDLDLRVLTDGSWYILDEDEFELHRVKYGYPDVVQQGARQAVQDLIALVDRRQGPFASIT